MTDDDGATMVEFVAGIGLVVLLLLALVQVAVYAYAGNVARHAAHEAARAGAEVGRPDGDAASVAGRLLEAGLGASGRRFGVLASRRSGLSVVEVSGRAPSLLPFVPELPVRARSEVLLEEVQR